MTAPILCLNCGKAKSEHTAAVAGDPFCSAGVFTDKRWLDQTPIENRVAEQIATFIENEWYQRQGSPGVSQYTAALTRAIRSGAWRTKP